MVVVKRTPQLTMNRSFDIIVIGLGANGSSALYHLSKSGYKVAGIDRFMPPHTYGSSHGESRIIRQAYFESPVYVPLVKEAYTLWQELEQLSGNQLFLRTGGIMLGKEDSAVVSGARFSAETHGMAYEYLQGKEIAQRFPSFKAAEETVGVVEKEAGILFPEKCIAANLQLAAANSAVLFYNEQVTVVQSSQNLVTVITDKNTYQTRKLIVSAGAWLNQLLPELNLPLTIERQVQYWFTNSNALLQHNLLPNALPIYIWSMRRAGCSMVFPILVMALKSPSIMPEER